VAPGDGIEKRAVPGPMRGLSVSTRCNLELTRQTLMLAWYVARMECGAAAVLLGMADEVAGIMMALGLIDIERIAARHGRFLRLRWSESPQMWRALLKATSSNDPDARADVHWHGLQLIGGAILAQSNNLHRRSGLSDASSR
jgi:hypothetical protein